MTIQYNTAYIFIVSTYNEGKLLSLLLFTRNQILNQLDPIIAHFWAI